MSRFGSTTYNAQSGTDNGNDNDYKDREAMLLGRYAILTMNLDAVGVYDGNFGKNIILNMDDVAVNEGVITERSDNGDGEADEKLKVMGWDKWHDRDEENEMELIPLEGTEEISTDHLGTIVTESAGGDDYKYTVQEGVLEGRDDPIDVGDRDLWLGNGKKARTLAKVLSSKGHDVIDKENKRDDHDWLAVDSEEEFDLRDELEGRRIMFWFEQTTLTPEDIDDLDEEVTFTDSVVLDAESDSPITIPNESDSSESESDDSSDDESETSTSIDAEPEESEWPRDIEELLSMFARTNQSHRGSVESLVREEAPDDFEVDMDEIMADLESRM